MSRPWMKFYPTDWRADPALRMCSITARGLWMEMLCIMHEAHPRGWLVVNGKAFGNPQLARQVGASLEETVVALQELEDAGVFSRDANGTIYSRRMQRDEEKAAKDKSNGSAGGNPDLFKGVNPGVNPPLNPQSPESEPDPDTSSLRSDVNAPARETTPQAELETVLDTERARAVVEHRQRIKRPMTVRAAQLLAKEFAKAPDPNVAADAMIANGWQGFEVAWLENRGRGPPLRVVAGQQNSRNPHGHRTTTADLARALADEARAREAERGDGPAGAVVRSLPRAG